MYNKKDALTIYKRQYLYSLILECLSDSKGVVSNVLLQKTTRLVNKDIKWNATIPDIHSALQYLNHIGMIELTENNIIKLTDIGLEALRKCTFQQLAATTYFNYQGLKNNRLSIYIASISLVIALLALLSKLCLSV